MLFAWENFNLCQHCFPVLFLTMRARDLTSILFFFFPLSWVLPVKCLPPKLGREGLDLKQCLLRGSFQQFKNHSHSLASIMSHWDFEHHPSGEQKMQSKNPKGFLCCPSLMNTFASVNTVASGCLLCQGSAWPWQRKKQTVVEMQAEAPLRLWEQGEVVHHCRSALLYQLSGASQDKAARLQIDGHHSSGWNLYKSLLSCDLFQKLNSILNLD